jgi:hypothetical protein
MTRDDNRENTIPVRSSMSHGCSSSGVSPWIVGRVVLVARLVRVPVPGAGTVTTAMLHRRGSDHGDAPSSWLSSAGAGAGAGAVPVPVVRERPLGRAGLADPAGHYTRDSSRRSPTRCHHRKGAGAAVIALPAPGGQINRFVQINGG